MSKVLYIAGPMSRIPQYNFPLFEAAAVALREEGYTIVSPHECDSKETRAAAWASPDGVSTSASSESWGECLARDVKMLADGMYTADERGVTGESRQPLMVLHSCRIGTSPRAPAWKRSWGC
jgi:hypothetical protein